MERFSTCVLPSPDSYDVVTSPFNACLSLVGLALQGGSVLAGTRSLHLPALPPPRGAGLVA